MYSFRRRSPKGQDDRAIHVKHFKNIPMADMELVLVSTGSCLFTLGSKKKSCLFTFIFISLTGFKLKKNLYSWQPEKKNPSLTPMDWVQFIVSVVIGLVSGLKSISFVSFVNCSNSTF